MNKRHSQKIFELSSNDILQGITGLPQYFYKYNMLYTSHTTAIWWFYVCRLLWQCLMCNQCQTQNVYIKIFYWRSYCWKEIIQLSSLRNLATAQWELFLGICWQKTSINPTGYGMLRLHLLQGGGGGVGLTCPDHQNLRIHQSQWNFVQVMKMLIEVYMRNFESLTFPLPEIWCHKFSIFMRDWLIGIRYLPLKIIQISRKFKLFDWQRLSRCKIISHTHFNCFYKTK